MIAATAVILASAAIATREPVHEADTAPDIDVGLAVCQAVRAQEAIERRWRQFEYVREDVIERRCDGRTTSRSSVTSYVHRTRPAGIEVDEPIARDGARLIAAEAARERQRAEDRLRQLREDPREHARAHQRSQRSSDEKTSTMSGMDAAFDLRHEGFDWLGDELCHVVSFFPKASYRPTTKAQETFQKMAGVVWVRRRDPLFLRLEADFIDNTSTKYGPFATITRGSHLRLDQGDAVAGAPLAFVLDLDLYLRLFFFLHRNERQAYYFRDFKRANPEPDQTFVP